ncbi:MAG: hypothetical protein PHH54_01570 [Candidatus Nanoarchaeia archaeon]|nr:hypothetical protein [Candidatus Nanoarchaeia archaeon]MDD5740653.1 hypothetical protein [Candidatus Nanoarchaeia archaeon]
MENNQFKILGTPQNRKSKIDSGLAEKLNEYYNKPENQKKTNKKQQANSETDTQTNSAVNIPNPNIDTSRYIQVGINGLYGKPVVISPYEVQESNNKTYEDTHKFALQKGVYIPTPKIFMAHLVNVVNAAKGNNKLSYSDGTPVSKTEAKEIYKHLTINYKDIFGKNNPGAWTWLNAKFVKGNGFNNLALETITGIDNKGNLIRTNADLENCLPEDCFADLDFNSQGLAVKKSTNQDYSRGDNIKFWYPRNGAVAGFDAYSGRASLDCDRYPGYRGASLGVFVCAEGTQKN